MPVLTIYTNLGKSSIPEKFTEEAADAFAQAIGKAKEVLAKPTNFIGVPCGVIMFIFAPGQYIWICVVPDLVMAKGGDCSPCARCEVISIGNLGEKENVSISKAICDMISSKLSIDYER